MLLDIGYSWKFLVSSHLKHFKTLICMVTQQLYCSKFNLIHTEFSLSFELMFKRSCWAIICNILETKHSQSNAAEKEEIPESSLCMIPVFFVCGRSEIVTTFRALICNSPGILFMFWWYMLQCFLSRWSWKQKYHSCIHDLWGHNWMLLAHRP